MADEKMSMPASFGGLVRYFDEYKSRIQIKPEHVVIMIIVLISIEIVIRL